MLGRTGEIEAVLIAVGNTVFGSLLKCKDSRTLIVRIYLKDLREPLVSEASDKLDAVIGIKIIHELLADDELDSIFVCLLSIAHDNGISIGVSCFGAEGIFTEKHTVLKKAYVLKLL